MSSEFLKNPQPLANGEIGRIVRLLLKDGFKYQLKCSIVGSDGLGQYEVRVLEIFDSENGSEITGGSVLEKYHGQLLQVQREMIFLPTE